MHEQPLLAPWLETRTEGRRERPVLRASAEPADRALPASVGRRDEHGLLT